MKSQTKKILIGAIILGSLALPVKSFAQDSNSPIDELETEVAKLDDIYDDVLPVAIGSMAFSIGAVIIKRIAFS